jgi:hypothetical protein
MWPMSALTFPTGKKCIVALLVQEQLTLLHIWVYYFNFFYLKIFIVQIEYIYEN